MGKDKPSEYEYKLLVHQHYKEERKILIEGEAETSRDHDKAILTISSGAIGLSIGLVGLVSQNIRPETYFLLVVSWILFGASLLTSLFTFRKSADAFRREIEILDNAYNGTQDLGDNKHTDIVKTLSLIATVYLIVAIFFLCFFMMLNIK